MADVRCFLGGSPQASDSHCQTPGEETEGGSAQSRRGQKDQLHQGWVRRTVRVLARCRLQLATGAEPWKPAAKELSPRLSAQLLQPCPTLCDPVDLSPPGSSVHGILQARILEWVAVPSSGGSSRPRDRTRVSGVAGASLLTGPAGKPKQLRAVVRHTHIYFQQSQHLLFIIQSPEILDWHLSEEVVPGGKKKFFFACFLTTKGSYCRVPWLAFVHPASTY